MPCIPVSNETISCLVNFVLSGEIETETTIINLEEASKPILSRFDVGQKDIGLSLAMTIRVANEKYFCGAYPGQTIFDNFPEFQYIDSIGFKSFYQLFKSIDFLMYNCEYKDVKWMEELQNRATMVFIRASDEYEEADWQ